MNPAADPRQMRRIIAEDPEWNLATVPLLTELCVNHIIKHFAENPILNDLLPRHQKNVLDHIDVNVPIKVTAPLIGSEDFWKRSCKSRWEVCDASLYDGCWKRMYFERNLEEIIEHYVPSSNDTRLIDETLALSAPFIRALNIKQLLPPVKEPVNAAIEDDLSDNESDSGDAPTQDHYEMKHVISRLPHLEELHLVYGVRDCGMNFEWNLFEFTQNDCLSLSNALKACTTLKMLHLHKSKVDDEKCRVIIANLLDHPALESLDLSYNKIGDSGARAIGKLVNGRSKLTQLDLTDNRIGATGAAAIAHAITKNTTLKKLSLRLNRLKDDGMQSFCRALVKNNTLEEVNLASNEFGSACAPFITQVLVYNKSLTHLNISCNTIGSEGGKTLQEGMEDNSLLTRMDLRLTEVGQEVEYCINQLLKVNLEAKRKPIV